MTHRSPGCPSCSPCSCRRPPRANSSRLAGCGTRPVYLPSRPRVPNARAALPIRVPAAPAGGGARAAAPPRPGRPLDLEPAHVPRPHRGRDLAQDVGRHEPKLGGPRRTRGPHIEDLVLQPVRGGVCRDVLADDPVPLGEESPGGHLVVPPAFPGDLTHEPAERLGVPGVRAGSGPPTSTEALAA